MISPAKPQSTPLAARFIYELAVGETITSAASVATVYSGADTDPSAILDGDAVIIGSEVEQDIKNGVLGVVYEVACTATTNRGQILPLSTLIAVVQDEFA
jgi:hypothetical protein